MIDETLPNLISVTEFRLRLKHWPAVCVRFDGAAEPVSHEMLSYLGQLTAQFTVEEHRCKGLGAIVERALAKRVLKYGLILILTTFRKNVS